MLMDNKGVNGIAGGMNNNFDARIMTPQAPVEQAPQMPMGQMSPEQMQSMMRMMQAQLDQMRANNNTEQNTATPENFAPRAEAASESMILPKVEQAPMMVEQEKNREAQPASAPVEKKDDEESPVIAALEQETANIPMQRDADNLAFITKVMGKVNWKNPHEAVNVMNWSKWKYLEGTFARRKGDGYGSGRAA